MKAAHPRLRQLAATAGKGMSAAELEEGLAHLWLQVNRDSLPPITAKTRKSLETILKALSDLDGAARMIMGALLGGPTVGIRPDTNKPYTWGVEKLEAEIKSCLDSLKITRGHDIYYRLALQHLIQAWSIRHGRSPLTISKNDKDSFDDFQKWAGAIMEDYGKPAPGKHIVEDCLAEPVDRKSDMRLNPAFTRFP
jgi:hypothetical protein